MAEKKIELTQRIAWEAKCPCGWSDLRVEDPPRESLCPNCKTWVSYIMRSWTGTDTFGK